MGKYIASKDLIGKVFKNLTVTEVIDIPEVKGRKLICNCNCGEQVTTTYSAVRAGNTVCECQVRIKQKNHVGNKYNLLTIESLDESNTKNVITNCECGGTKSVNFGLLLLGKIKSCGCLSKSKPTVGEIYNRFTIIEDLPSIKYGNSSYKQVKAQCECGNTRNICYKDLKKGKSKSCGCINAEIKIDIVKNNVYNNWTIISEGKPYISTKGKVRTVNAKCICGKEKSNITLNSIVHGKSKSCGCQGLPKKEKIEKQVLPIPISTEEEQWKEAFGYDNYYISDKGRLFTTVGNNRFINKLNNITASLWDKGVRNTMHIPAVVYKTFIEDYNQDEYRILHIDEDIYNFDINNLFLARLTKSKEDWVTRAMGKMIASAREKKGQRRKIITIKRKDIIEQYIRQEGLSTFLKLPMDLTGVDNLLGISVDRIDNAKDYVPGNITLVTRFENMGRRSATFDECMSFCAPLLCNR